ncbi:MAG TPA: LysR family transcriptional regulator [Terriglobia bacterium]|nr:LysR family transcriptional regulator [Terriglobia bacterium]
MELSQLEAFLAVVEEKSFSRAAGRLLRTQPAVSQAVRRLEEWAGEPLLDRSTKSGVLTAAGATLFGYAQKVINLRQEAHLALEEMRALERGRVTIGANESTALYLLPVLKRFHERHPRVQVAVKRSLSREIPGALLRFEVELGVLSYNPQNRDLESTVVSLDELCLIVPPRHPLAAAKEVSVRALGGEQFIAHNVSSPYRQRVIETFARHHTPLQIAAELPTVETIKKFVAMGMGVAFVPRMCVREELARGEFVALPVSELRIQRKLRLIYRRHTTLSAAAQGFLDVARALAEKPPEA